MRSDRALVPKSRARRATIVAISGGKGGVGKTFITVNLAAELKEQGYKVLIFDADINLSNVNILLHIDQNNSFKDFLTSKIPIQDIIRKGLCGIDAIYVGDEINKLTKLNNEQIDTISKALFELEEYYDYILIDTQASLDSATLEFITFSDQVILIANPEITALVDLYKTIKILCSKKRGIPLHILVNKATSAESAGKIFMKIKNTVSEFGLKTFLIFLGYILFDPQRVIESIQKRTPIILLNESGSLRQCFTLIANAFLRGAKPKRKKLFFLDLLRKS